MLTTVGALPAQLPQQLPQQRPQLQTQLQPPRLSGNRLSA
jgi:hypothetical protein